MTSHFIHGVLFFMSSYLSYFFFFFFFNDPSTTQIYTLSLHDALPISVSENPNQSDRAIVSAFLDRAAIRHRASHRREVRSEEHTSELQSHHDLVCRLLLEKKKKNKKKKNKKNII